MATSWPSLIAANFSSPFQKISTACYTTTQLPTCKNCNRFWTLQVGVQMDAAPEQDLQAAVALVQTVTCV